MDKSNLKFHTFDKFSNFYNNVTRENKLTKKKKNMKLTNCVRSVMKNAYGNQKKNIPNMSTPPAAHKRHL